MPSSNAKRQDLIVQTLTEAFGPLMAADAEGFRTKFRKMAADPFAFYRGSACLFYADMAARKENRHDERTGRVWIHGDLHAENFGTYMNAEGVLVFDVNDFDEAYLGDFSGTCAGSWPAWPCWVGRRRCQRTTCARWPGPTSRPTSTRCTTT